MSVYALQATKPKAAPVETATVRLDRLRAEVAAIAREQTVEFEQAVSALIAQALEISEGGEAYPVGAREIARRLGDQLTAAALTLEALRMREAR